LFAACGFGWCPFIALKLGRNHPEKRTMAWELLVEGYDDRRTALLAVDKSSEEPWLRNALSGVALLDQSFAVRLQGKAEAEALAGRIRDMGFRCKVWTGPDPSKRIGRVC
jgi:hypothetical protein